MKYCVCFFGICRIHTIFSRRMMIDNMTVICLISMTTVSLPLSIKLSLISIQKEKKNSLYFVYGEQICDK